MEKILTLIGLKPPKYRFNDFETNLRMHYLANFGIDVVLAIFIVIFAITSRFYTALWFFLALFAILTIMHVYGLMQLLGGQVMVFEGVCKEIEKNMKTVLKKQVMGKSNIEVEYENLTYIVPVSYNSSFKKGSVIKIYYIEGEIYSKDEDTYIVPNPVYVTKSKNPPM